MGMLTLELVAGSRRCSFGGADVAGLEHARVVYEAVRDEIADGLVPCPPGFAACQLVGTYESPAAGPFAIVTDHGGRTVIRDEARR